MTSSRLVSLSVSWRAPGYSRTVTSSIPADTVAVGDHLDQRAAAGERVGVAGEDVDRQVGADARRAGRRRRGRRASASICAVPALVEAEAARRIGDVEVDLGLVPAQPVVLRAGRFERAR